LRVFPLNQEGKTLTSEKSDCPPLAVGLGVKFYSELEPDLLSSGGRTAGLLVPRSAGNGTGILPKVPRRGWLQP